MLHGFARVRNIMAGTYRAGAATPALRRGRAALENIVILQWPVTRTSDRRRATDKKSRQPMPSFAGRRGRRGYTGVWPWLALGCQGRISAGHRLTESFPTVVQIPLPSLVPTRSFSFILRRDYQSSGNSSFKSSCLFVLFLFLRHWTFSS